MYLPTNEASLKYLLLLNIIIHKIIKEYPAKLEKVFLSKCQTLNTININNYD